MSIGSNIGEAFVRIRPDTAGFAGETKRSITGIVGRAAGYAGLGLGIAEVVKQIREANKVERERSLIVAQADTALKAAGQSWDQYGQHIDDAIQKQSKLSAFDDEDLLKSFTLLFRATKDVNSALDLNSIAANVARGRNLDLTRTAQLLVRVQAGQVGSLRRLGIQIDKHATGMQAIAAVRKQYAGSAVTFARSEEGAAARLNKVWNDTQEIVGKQLVPTIAEYQRKLAEWLNKANETGETQRKLNEYFGQGKAVVKGFVEGFQTARSVIEPFVELLGGTERAVRLVLIVMAARKVALFAGAVRGVAASFGLIAPAAVKAGAAVVESSAVAIGALTREQAAAAETALAYERSAIRMRRARGIAGAVALGALAFGDKAPGGQTGTDLVNIGAAAAFGFSVGGPVGAAVAGGGAVIAASLAQDKRTKAAAQAKWNSLTYEEQQAVMADFRRRRQGERQLVTFLNMFDLKVKTKQVNTKRAQGYRSGREGDVLPTLKEVPVDGGKVTGKQATARVAAFEESQLNAQIKNDVPRQRRSLEAEKAYVERAIKNGRLSVAERRQLKSTLKGIQDSIDGIDQQIASDKKAASDKADTARKAAQTAADKAFDRRISTTLGGLERKRREAAAKSNEQEQARILRQEEAFLTKQIAAAKRGSDRRQRLQDQLTKVHERQSTLRKKQAGTSTGVDTVYAQLERDRREAAARKDDAAQERILAAEEKHVRALIAKAKKGSDRKQRLLNELTSIHEKQARLKQAKGSGSAFTLQQFFQEAADEFSRYGSNVTPTVAGGGILSGQDARGAVSKLALDARGGTTKVGTPNIDPAIQTAINQRAQQTGQLEKHTVLLTKIAESVAPKHRGGTPPARGGGHPPTRAAENARRKAAYTNGS